MNTLSNHRSHQRHLCRILVHYDAYNQGGLGVLTDVSQGGVRLSCRPGKVGKYIKLSAVTQPENSSSKTCLGKVVWQGQNPRTGQVELGIELPLDLEWLEQALLCSQGAKGVSTPELFSGDESLSSP